ncbi:MAG TPA: protein-L-isoaspartate(D-aspartate) O-methyltransferase [Anaeromyxobacteraceae bacterium]|nr:protein-L-isoaspartate(D-aspartate) O-methyltransferase [Anaeromyxobacteraceae bacterium]
MTLALAAQLRSDGIRDERVLEVMARLDRARFVPERWQGAADADHPLPIGFGQTISQPWLVAWMTELLRLAGAERVLEIGTGSGYQAAILAALAGEVWSIELVPELAAAARRVLLDELGLANVHLAVGDGAQGWPEAAPFDRIVVTAAAPAVPPALVAQLAPGGRMLIPVGEPETVQWLRLVELDRDGRPREQELSPVRFVPLVRRPAS